MKHFLLMLFESLIPAQLRDNKYLKNFEVIP